MTEARQLETLTRDESLGLLSGVPVGRVVFTHHALPAVLPVNHVMDSGQVIIRASQDTALSSQVANGAAAVVAYEADVIDPGERLGWSIVVVGKARRVQDPEDIARYSQILTPWATGGIDDIIAISADLVTGFRLTQGPVPTR